MAEPSDPYAQFLHSGEVPGAPAPTEEDRLAFIRAGLRDDAFKRLAWPHFAAFVDASNVARARPPPVHMVTEPKARLALLTMTDAALRKLGYVPIVVSDGSLFHVIDDPYGFKAKYGSYPHAIAKGQSADHVVLRALRRLPEAIVITRDRFDKPDEVRDFGDVLADKSRFYRWTFNEAYTEVAFAQRETGAPLPRASRRLAARFS